MYFGKRRFLIIVCGDIYAQLKVNLCHSIDTVVSYPHVFEYFFGGAQVLLD